MPPASTRPTGRHGAGPRTAQPSMLEVGKAGRSVRARSGSARVRPSAAASGTTSAGPAAARPPRTPAAAPSSQLDRGVIRAHHGRAYLWSPPRIWSTVCAQDRAQHGQPVLGAAGRAGQVDDQGPPGHPGQPAGQRRGRHRVPAVRADRLGDAGDLEVEQAAGRLRGAVGRGDAGAAAGQHDVDAVGDGRPQRLGDRVAVRHHHRARRPRRSRGRAGPATSSGPLVSA